MVQLRPYQEKFVTDLSRSVHKHKQVIGQMATGGGKTIVFSTICDRYKGNVIILVHRVELLQQTRRTLYDVYGITAQIIVAGMRVIPKARVYVGMVETVFKRINQISDIGLVIIDECHIANFNKIHQHFESAMTIGFTATPLAANKNDPLKKYYNDIVCCIDIPELIKQGSLCQNITYAPKDVVDRESLKVKGNDFDDGMMAASFSAPRYVISTVNAYKRWAKGTKTIIFNVNIEHSILVTKAFLAAGYNAKHVDGTSEDRVHTIRWFRTTPDAILCNVGIGAVGLDVPSIETVIPNKSTKSMPLWLQMTGRGSRPTPSKSAFTIIDMGANAINLGDWCDARDWENIFWNPPKKGKPGTGVAPVKNCPQCDAIIPVQCRECQHCNYIYPPRELQLEEILEDFILVTKNINVHEIIENNRHRKEYYPFFQIGNTLAYQAGQTIHEMNDEHANYILSKYNVMAAQWCHEVGKKYNQWHKERAKEHLFTELSKAFKQWQPAAQLAI